MTSPDGLGDEVLRIGGRTGARLRLSWDPHARRWRVLCFGGGSAARRKAAEQLDRAGLWQALAGLNASESERAA